MLMHFLVSTVLVEHVRRPAGGGPCHTNRITRSQASAGDSQVDGSAQTWNLSDVSVALEDRHRVALFLQNAPINDPTRPAPTTAISPSANLAMMEQRVSKG